MKRGFRVLIKLTISFTSADNRIDIVFRKKALMRLVPSIGDAIRPIRSLSYKIARRIFVSKDGQTRGYI
jgi:hypothetical protein